MNLQDIANIVAILTFAKPLFLRIWRIIRKPVMQKTIALIDALIEFLERVRRWARARSGGEDASSYVVWRAVTFDTILLPTSY